MTPSSRSLYSQFEIFYHSSNRHHEARSALGLLRVFDNVREDVKQLGCLFPELEVGPAIPEEEYRVPRFLPCSDLVWVTADVYIAGDDDQSRAASEGLHPLDIGRVRREFVFEVDCRICRLKQAVERPSGPRRQIVVEKEVHAARRDRSNRAASLTDWSGTSYQCATSCGD